MKAHRAIRVMPPEVAQQIAAGEVVERPASALKELLDNAVDAGARHVAIEIREAGLKSLRVSDDGCGIPRAELALAFTSHATSKIRDSHDLEALETLGFRGEALPSIAAVARVDIQSRSDQEDVGSRLNLEFGTTGEVRSAAVPQGTRITVTDLFANVPARRKFVRSRRAEGGQIQSVVSQYALAQPFIRFELSMDGRSTFCSPGTGQLADALAAVYGPSVLADTCPVEAIDQGIVIEGLISKPALTRPTRSALHLFVNGRPIQNRSLGFALEEAYSGFLMSGRHPLAAVHIRVSPAEVDPNIHPSKNEVRFARERDVHGVLYRAVANALLELRLAERQADSRPTFEVAEAVANTPLPLSSEAGTSESAVTQTSLLPHLPALRVFGQTNQAFIVAEGPRGVYMIDQHAAHERILFDRFDIQMKDGTVSSQSLLEPEAIDLEPAHILALEENQELLVQAGFLLEPFGNRACLIRAVPIMGGRTGPSELVREVLSELQNLPEPGAARERALAAMACKSAVKAGQTLGVDEMRELVMQLERTLRPATCPHGRPTMIHLSHLQLEREFGRR